MRHSPREAFTRPPLQRRGPEADPSSFLRHDRAQHPAGRTGRGARHDQHVQGDHVQGDGVEPIAEQRHHTAPSHHTVPRSRRTLRLPVARTRSPTGSSTSTPWNVDTVGGVQCRRDVALNAPVPRRGFGTGSMRRPTAATARGTRTPRAPAQRRLGLANRFWTRLDRTGLDSGRGL